MILDGNRIEAAAFSIKFLHLLSATVGTCKINTKSEEEKVNKVNKCAYYSSRHFFQDLLPSSKGK